MPTRKKIDLQDILLASVNTFCPECKAQIEPSQIMRVSFDEIKCPWCDAIFQTRKTA
jgi:hypothetical protein